ncbi:MAG: hypothetical protein LBR89_04720 [Holosporales bacterium]|nr:hypothetical protein [Holosporales bacterium]
MKVCLCIADDSFDFGAMAYYPCILHERINLRIIIFDKCAYTQTQKVYQGVVSNPGLEQYV